MSLLARKKKILLVITKSNFGGAQRYVYDLATSLPKETFEVVVAAGGNGVLLEKLRSAHIRIISIPGLERNINLIKELRVFFFLLKLYRTEKPDIVHLNSSKIGGIGALAGRITFVPCIVFTAHGWAFNESRDVISKLVIRIAVWVILLLSHTTITVSSALQREVRSFPFVQHKLVLVHNGIRKSPLLPREQAHQFFKGKFSFAVPDNAFWFATIAELHTSKGLSYLLETAERLQHAGENILFVIMGDGEKKEVLQQYITDNHLDETVVLTGFVEDAPQYLKAFDGYVLPSITEAFGLSILEAGYAKLAVVTTNVGGIPEIIEHEKTGLLVPPRDAPAIATAIEKLTHDETLRVQLGANLKQKVEQKFSFEKMLNDTIAVYKN